MTRIGLISDTHGYLDETVFKHFENAMKYGMAAILAVLNWLKDLSSFKPLKGVYGNIDGTDISSIYPGKSFFSM